jgi:hypothetical protein
MTKVFENSLARVEAVLAAKGLTASRLDLGAECIGTTGYIDQLKVSNFPRGVQYGYDHHGRPYVAVAVHRSQVGVQDGFHNRDFVAVAFKRYTDPNHDLWVCPTPHIVGTCTEVLNTFLGYMAEGKHQEPSNAYDDTLMYAML